MKYLLSILCLSLIVCEQKSGINIWSDDSKKSYFDNCLINTLGESEKCLCFLDETMIRIPEDSHLEPNDFIECIESCNMENSFDNSIESFETKTKINFDDKCIETIKEISAI